MPKHILVVDDEEHVRKLVCKRLEVSGFETTEAVNGEDALVKVKETIPDLIILDVMMPKLDGYNVCAMLKREKDYESIPIIMLTAKGQDRDVQMGMVCGADAYISKPFESARLLEQINRLLQLPQTRNS